MIAPLLAVGYLGLALWWGFRRAAAMDRSAYPVATGAPAPPVSLRPEGRKLDDPAVPAVPAVPDPVVPGPVGGWGTEPDLPSVRGERTADAQYLR